MVKIFHELRRPKVLLSEKSTNDTVRESSQPSLYPFPYSLIDYFVGLRDISGAKSSVRLHKIRFWREIFLPVNRQKFTTMAVVVLITFHSNFRLHKRKLSGQQGS